MFKYKTAKRSLYYDEVVRLHFENGCSCGTLAKKFPIDSTTIRSWLRNFAEEQQNKEKEAMPKQKSNKPEAAESDEVKRLRAENARLQKELDRASLRAEAYNHMIDIAEREFNIPIRKKPGAKQ